MLAICSLCIGGGWVCTVHRFFSSGDATLLGCQLGQDSVKIYRQRHNSLQKEDLGLFKKKRATMGRGEKATSNLGLGVLDAHGMLEQIGIGRGSCHSAQQCIVPNLLVMGGCNAW